MLTFNQNVVAAIDVETTGLIDGYHEIIQVACVPLNQNFDPLHISPFYMNIKPDHPERASKEAMNVNKLDLKELEGYPNKWQVAECFDEWFESLNLPMFKRLIPLTQNAPFDIPFLKHWLGILGYEKYFVRRGRDTMFAALALNDQAAWKNRPIPFDRVGLKDLCQKLGVPLDNHHDALADCLATAQIYRELLRLEV